MGFLERAAIYINGTAITLALAALTDDWSRLALDACPLTISKDGARYAIPIPLWAKALQYLYEQRNAENVDTVIHQLCQSSHEKLDALLVILVGGRYYCRNFSANQLPRHSEKQVTGKYGASEGTVSRFPHVICYNGAAGGPACVAQPAVISP